MISLPEYDRNPYIAGLSPVLGPRQVAEMLSRPPSWDAADLTLSPHLRRHCVQRLKDYFLPGGRSVMFADDFGMLLRRGYVGRDPTGRRHEARVLRVAEQVEGGLLLSAAASLGFANNADSSLLAGMPGMGKTLTIREVLGSYPQVVEHRDMPPQIVYLRLDTPVRGSVRGLCVDFFARVDALLGQETYTRLYAGHSATEESMMSNMALVSNLHALGCLVIDEIQHLPGGNDAPRLAHRVGEADHDLIRFMVTLTNKMGVPVLFVGMMNAENLFNRTACMARRSVGNFGGAWRNYAKDAREWSIFLDDLWQYQWTRSQTKLTPELREAMHDETQGVVDLAVKLFMRAQIRLILRTDGNHAFSEELNPGFVRHVAEIDFRPVRGFVDALRANDPAQIARYQDLSAFSRTFDSDTGVLAGLHSNGVSTPRRREQPGDASAPVFGAAEQAVRDDLARRGLQADVIDSTLAAALDELGKDASVGVLLPFVERLLKPGKRKPVSVPHAQELLVVGDLRRLARDAVDEGRLVREVFADAGVGGAASLKLAA